jgi:hypothetical protein
VSHDSIFVSRHQSLQKLRGGPVRESGHNIALENPAALASKCLDFFASLKAGRARQRDPWVVMRSDEQIGTGVL